MTNIDREMLLAIKDAGCIGLGVGVESGSDRLLKHMKKGVTTGIMREKAKLLKEVGMYWLAMIIVGLPTETEEEMDMTLKFILETQPNRVGMCVFTPYPGTTFYNEIVATGVVPLMKNNDTCFIDKNYTGTMPDDRFHKLADRSLRFADCYNVIHDGATRHYYSSPLIEVPAYWARYMIAMFRGTFSRLYMRFSFPEIVN